MFVWRYNWSDVHNIWCIDSVIKEYVVFMYPFYSFQTSSDLSSLILEFVVKFESLLVTKLNIFKSSGFGPWGGKSSIAFILADDKSDSDRLV